MLRCVMWNVWRVKCVKWCVKSDVWCVMYVVWHLMCDVCYATFDVFIMTSSVDQFCFECYTNHNNTNVSNRADHGHKHTHITNNNDNIIDLHNHSNAGNHNYNDKSNKKNHASNHNNNASVRDPSLHIGIFNILNRISALNIFWYNRTPLLLFFSGSYDNTVRLWDVASQQEVAVLRGHRSYVYSVAFDGSGRFLASGERTWRGDDEEWREMIE